MNRDECAREGLSLDGWPNTLHFTNQASLIYLANGIYV